MVNRFGPPAPSASTVASDVDKRRVLLVTGAAGGIGSAVASRARETGWQVITWDIRPGCDQTIDITSPEQVEHALAVGEQTTGPIDALVHAAGIHREDDPLCPNPELWQKLIAANVYGTVTVCSAVAQRMLATSRPGRAIVAITSNAAHTPRRRMGAYGASKAAAAQYLRSLGLALAPHGIRCNAVSPGSTMTPMLGEAATGQGPAAERILDGAPEDFRLGIPLGRIARPEDIAAACLWLLAPEAAQVTMHDLRVDGGATLDAH